MVMMIFQTMEYEAEHGQKVLEQYLLQMADGDRDALAQLYRRTHAAVYAVALSMVKNAHDAQEIAQDTFVRIWECAPQYRPKGSPMAWILTVARNLARMQLRQNARLTGLSEQEWDAIPADSPGVTPEDRMLLQQAMAQLSDEERQVVMLHALTGLKHREIADLLEIPLATVLSKYHRAMKKLRSFMKGDDAQ